MTPQAIETALGQRLDAAAIAPVIFPNRETAAPVPSILFEHLPTVRRDDTLAGGGEVAEGYAVMACLTTRDAFSTAGLAMAEEVRALFPYASRLALAGGRALVITAPPRVLPGYPDGDAWRTPVRVDYRTT